MYYPHQIKAQDTKIRPFIVKLLETTKTHLGFLRLLGVNEISIYFPNLDEVNFSHPYKGDGYKGCDSYKGAIVTRVPWLKGCDIYMGATVTA